MVNEENSSYIDFRRNIMRKIAMGFFAVAVFAIILSGCDFNLFSAVDTVDVPSRSDLMSKAASDAPGLISDVHDYIDSGAVTAGNVGDVAAALKKVYENDTVPPKTREEAAVLAGNVYMESDENASVVVNNIVSTLFDTDNGSSEAKDILKDIFKGEDGKLLSKEKFTSVVKSFQAAAGGYNKFAGLIDDGNGKASKGAASWMDGSEKGDVVQYAVVSIVTDTIVEAIGGDIDALYYFVSGKSETLDGYDENSDPLDTINNVKVLLDFAGFSSN